MATQAIPAQTVGRPGRTVARNNAESVAERNMALFAAQQRARRGPTPEVFFTKHLDNSRLVKADDPQRTRERRSFSAALAVLFVLVMVYVWQHFSAIEYGYHVEAQKQQLELLNEQNRQLRLTEAQLTDPGRIDEMAHQLGLDAPQPGQFVRPTLDGSDPNAPVLAQVKVPAMPSVQ
jgi:cell division protein FtsL